MFECFFTLEIKKKINKKISLIFFKVESGKKTCFYPKFTIQPIQYQFGRNFTPIQKRGLKWAFSSVSQNQKFIPI